MPDQPDQTLLQQLAAGNEEAFGKLYDLLGQRLFKAAYRILGRQDEAEDAVQEVFLGLVRAGWVLAQVENLNAYLFASLHRASLRLAARRGVELHLSAAQGEAVKETGTRLEDETGIGERLDRALHSLPHEQREVLALKIDGGLTFEEIAEALHAPANTVASRYRYALEKLRAALSSEPRAQASGE
ncbi:MAG: sigma-70 family RNA polymerase sigma factor [Planctomycetota bacterium]